MKRKQTFNLARTAMLLLVMLCSMVGWAGNVTLMGDPYPFIKMQTRYSNTLNLDGSVTTFNVYDDGYIGDGGYNECDPGEGNYSSDCQGTLVMIAPSGYVFQLSGSVKLADSHDGLNVYDGGHDGLNIHSGSGNIPLLYSIAGGGGNYNSIPITTVTSTGNVMTLYFYSDEYGFHDGLDLTVKLIPKKDITSATDLGTITDVSGESGYYTLGSNIYMLTDNITTGGYLKVPNGVTAVLDLNGHTINRGLTTPTANGGVIRVEVGGNLTIKDSQGGGTITGGNNSYATGSAVEVAGDYQTETGGTLTLEGGIITGNIGKYAVRIGDYAHFTMTGGTITGNEGSGVDAGSQTVFEMSGGSITANSLYGIQTHDGQPTEIKFAGAPVVTGNTNGNLYLDKNCVFTISGEMTAGANIGITTESRPTTGSPVTLSTTDANLVTDANAAYFKADYYGQAVSNDGGTLKMNNTFTDQPIFDNGVLTLHGNVDASALINMTSDDKDEVTSVVCAPGTVLPGDCWNLFANFMQVQTIDLSNADMSHVTNISYMFYNCGAQTITFADNLQIATIGVQAFYNCTNVTSVTIPASVTSIGDYAFEECSHLESVFVLSPSCSLGSYVFDGCNSLAHIYVSSDKVDDYKAATNWSNYENIIEAPHWTSGDCTVSFVGTTLIVEKTDSNSATGAMADYAGSGQPWKDYRTSITNIVIEDGVTRIGNNAFNGCNNANLTSVTLPASVTEIGSVAFNGCTGLTSITLPNSLETIGNNAFNECANLETITLNGGVDIGDAAFPTTGNTSVTIANDLLLHNGTEPLSGTITDMTKLNGKTLQTTVPYTDDNGDPQSTTIDWATVNEGTQADPYMIYHPAQLLLLAYRVNGTHGETANDYSGKYFKLGANIAFSHEANEGNDYAENYEAIGRCENGSTDYNFKGDFDGDGHTVSGIRLRKTGDDYADWCQGLFGLISTGANIHDVHVTDARILGYKYVSGIVGYIEFGTVSNCTVTETAITATYNNCYGTICGDINSGTLQHNYYRHCTVNGTANATNVGCCRADDSKNDGAMPMYVAYIDANGNEQKCTDYTILDNTMTTISAGWYVVKSDVAFSGDLSTNADGEVNIILCDGATLTASKIDPIGNSDQLCIYGQSQGTGTANISGEITAFCAIRIYGGNITAEGIYVINGSLDLKGGTITAGTLAVNGGYINLAGATVEASMYGAPKSDVTIATGITYYDGQGSGYNNGKLTDPTVLNGKKLRTYDYRTVSYVKADGTSATVDARPLQGSTKDVTLGSDGATTWYVVNSDVNYYAITLKGNVNIILCDDKTMTSDGRSASAISGEYGYNNSLTIYGQSAGTGKLVAQCGEGNGISSGDITINGGTVDATGGDYSAINASGDITINGGNVSATGYPYGIEASGNIILGWTKATDRIYASSYSETVTIASGLVFTDGQGHNFYGTISDVSAIAGQTLQPVTNAIPYIDEDGTMACCTDFFVIDGSTTYFGNDNGWYVVNSNVTLNELRFTENANIILCDGAKLTVKNNNVRGDITAQDLYSASITVYAQSAGTGAIEAGAIKSNTSDITGAFITIYGGNVDINRLEAGFVDIYGGNITVNTAENQTKAAILGNSETRIYGGSVTVTANGCNGIQSNQGNILIYGGQVTATATGTGCYGISSVDYIRLGWTKATDFIQASSYKVGQNCDVYICDGQMMSDGTTIYSDYLDAQKDAIAGQKLVPYGFKTKANPHESDYWTSFYYGTANYSAPDGVTIYKAAIDGDHVQLTEVSGGIIRAGEAVILKTTASNVTTDGYLILPLTTTDATGDYSGNELKGVDVDTWQEDGYTYYVLSKKGDDFGFFKLAKKDSQNSNIHLGAHKAYLEVAPGNNAPAFYGFDDSDSEDGIENVNVNDNVNDNAIYNLAGQKLSRPQKGINIINGRKVLF